jgi:hypothetical protein
LRFDTASTIDHQSNIGKTTFSLPPAFALLDAFLFPAILGSALSSSSSATRVLIFLPSFDEPALAGALGAFSHSGQNHSPSGTAVNGGFKHFK